MKSTVRVDVLDEKSVLVLITYVICVLCTVLGDVNKIIICTFYNLICDERRHTSHIVLSQQARPPSLTSHLVSVSLYDHRLRHGSPGAPADQGGLLGHSDGLGGALLVVVVKAAEGNLLSVLEASEVLDKIIDHSDVFTIQIRLEKLSFFILKV